MTEWKTNGTWSDGEATLEPSGIEMGTQDLGFHSEFLSPGKFSNPCPFNNTELCMVLEGRALLRQNGQFREVLKGDVIFMERSLDPSQSHQFYNHTDEPFQFLAVSTHEDAKFLPREFIKD